MITIRVELAKVSMKSKKLKICSQLLKNQFTIFTCVREDTLYDVHDIEKHY